MNRDGQILVTGVTGFIGRRLAGRLAAEGAAVKGLARHPAVVAGCREVVPVGDLSGETDFAGAVAGIEAVIHLAARVHVMRETATDPLAAFRRVNVEATERLARQAAAAGVRRFVFVSSVKVNGESTAGRPFTEADPPAPQDAYGMSKWQAEMALARIAAETGLQVAIVRPPLVHGPGVGGNLRSLMKAIARGIPLPLAAIDNRRSLVGLDNLVDLLVLCAAHPAAAGQTFLAGDGEDLSTPDLVRRLAAAMGRRPRLVPVPPAALRLAGRLAGRLAAVERLCSSLQVDIAKAGRVLGWRPPLSLDEGLRRMAAEDRS